MAMLLKCGTDKNGKDTLGRSAVELAKMNDHEDLSVFLIAMRLEAVLIMICAEDERETEQRPAQMTSSSNTIGWFFRVSAIVWKF